MAGNASPRLVKILIRLARNWANCKSRYDRANKRLDRAGTSSAGSGLDRLDEEAEALDAAYYDHPFPGFVRLVSYETGFEQAALRDAALHEFDGQREFVTELNALDANGTTAALFAKLWEECPEVASRLFGDEASGAIANTGEQSGLVGFLNRASNVFGLANELGWEFHKDFKSQGPVVMIGDQSPRERHREKVNQFIATVLDLRDAVENPPDGSAAVVEQLREAGRIARRLREANEGDILELWPDLNQVAHDGYQVVKAARKAARLDDPFAFLDDAPKPGDSPIASAKEFHEMLAVAFSTAAETAVWMVQYIRPDPNAEVVKRLRRLVLQVDRLTKASRYLKSFREARIATKAASEAARFQGPDGEWYASYHDAALGLTVGLLGLLTLPNVNESGEVESYSIQDDVVYSCQQHAPRWRRIFDEVIGEYQAGMAAEAAAVGSEESAGVIQKPSDSLVYTAGAHGWKLNKQLPDGSLTDPSSAKVALANALQVARASAWLRQKCDQYGAGGALFESYLPEVLNEADRLWHALVGLQHCLSDSAMRRRLGDTHTEAVSYAGEVAPSYVEAIYRAGERQYETINMLCRHGVLFNYLSKLHPAQAEKISEPWPKLPKVDEIEFTGHITADARGNSFHAPVKLLAAICRQVRALPSIDPDHALIFLEKEVATVHSAENDSGEAAVARVQQAVVAKLHTDPSFRTGWERASAKVRAMVEAMRTASPEICQLEEEWESDYGAPYPKTIAEWERWAARIGWSGERITEGDWTPAELFPIIEGYLLKHRDQQQQPQMDVGPGAGSGPENAGQPSLQARALALLADHPEWTDTRIAEVLGCNRGSLYRLSKFKAARELLRQNGRASAPRGSKDDGRIEAWEADE